MLAKTDWMHLIPHQGTMCLLDAVVMWDDSTIHAISETHRYANHPLRGEQGLHAVHLAEYGAQAMAVHGALCDRERGHVAVRPGRLVSLRDIKLAVEFVEVMHGRLDVHAQRIHADASGAQYGFRVEHEGRLLVDGRATVIHPAD